MDFIDGQFRLLRGVYEKMLRGALKYLPVTVSFAVIILVSNYFLFSTSKSELAPQEDQGIIISLITAPPNATLQQTQLSSKEVYKIMAGYSENDHVFQLDSLNTGIAGMVMKPWDARTRTSMQLQPLVQQKLGNIAGVRAVAFSPPPLPGGGGGLPVQFIIGTTDSFERLDEVSQALMDKARASGMFAFIDNDIKIDKPQNTIVIDRDKTAQLGLTMRDVGG